MQGSRHQTSNIMSGWILPALCTRRRCFATKCTGNPSAVSLLSGLVMFNPVQFYWLGWLMGGFHYARIWHFIAMCGFLAFVPGHLFMAIIHGWHNFRAMLADWLEETSGLSFRIAPRIVPLVARAPFQGVFARTREEEPGRLPSGSDRLLLASI